MLKTCSEISNALNYDADGFFPHQHHCLIFYKVGLHLKLEILPARTKALPLAWQADIDLYLPPYLFLVVLVVLYFFDCILLTPGTL